MAAPRFHDLPFLATRAVTRASPPSRAGHRWGIKLPKQRTCYSSLFSLPVDAFDYPSATDDHVRRAECARVSAGVSDRLRFEREIWRDRRGDVRWLVVRARVLPPAPPTLPPPTPGLRPGVYGRIERCWFSSSFSHEWGLNGPPKNDISGIWERDARDIEVPLILGENLTDPLKWFCIF